MKYLKYISFTALSIVFILWLLNPTYKDFQEFAAERNSTQWEVGFKRVNNYIIFSIYEKTTVFYDDDIGRKYTRVSKTVREKFTGFLKNFYKITS